VEPLFLFFPLSNLIKTSMIDNTVCEGFTLRGFSLKGIKGVSV
jgi:hypothetical protein